MNHLELTVETHQTSTGAIRVVGFEVEAFSVFWGNTPCQGSVDSFHKGKGPDSFGAQLYNRDSSLSYTYRVIFKKSDLIWAQRFDHFLKLGNSKVHHTQFIVACLIALFFTVLVYKILRRTLSKDLMLVARNKNALRHFRRNRTEIVYDSVAVSEDQEETSSTASER